MLDGEGTCHWGNLDQRGSVGNARVPNSAGNSEARGVPILSLDVHLILFLLSCQEETEYLIESNGLFFLYGHVISLVDPLFLDAVDPCVDIFA